MIVQMGAKQGQKPMDMPKMGKIPGDFSPT